MNIVISNSDKKPIYEQIAEQIKLEIISNKLLEGEKIPSIRLLAKELRISVITTKRAYDELEKEGYLHTVPGKGTFVASKDTNLIEESVLKKIENSFLEGIELSKLINLELEDLKLILETLYLED